MLLAQILLVLAGLLIIVTPVAASRGVLARNNVLGVRLPAVMASERAWEEGHRAAIPSSIVGGAATIVGAALVSFVVTEEGRMAVFVASFIILTVCAARSGWRATSAARPFAAEPDGAADGSEQTGR